MRRRRLPPHAALLALLALLLSALAAPTAAAQDRTLHVEITDRGFRFRELPGLNPGVALAPGEDVLFRVENLAATAHDLALGPPLGQATTCCLDPGETATLRVRVPADAEGEASYVSTRAPETHRGVLRLGAPEPAIRMLSPADGADVGATFDVLVEVRGFTLEPYVAGRAPEPGRGHVRYLVDGRFVEGPSERTGVTVTNLTEGFHLVRAELVGRDGQPLSPPVHADAVVYRTRDAPTPPPTDGTQEPPRDDARTPGPGAGLTLIAAGLALVLAAARRTEK